MDHLLCDFSSPAAHCALISNLIQFSYLWEAMTDILVHALNKLSVISLNVRHFSLVLTESTLREKALFCSASQPRRMCLEAGVRMCI